MVRPALPGRRIEKCMIKTATRGPERCNFVKFHLESSNFGWIIKLNVYFYMHRCLWPRHHVDQEYTRSKVRVMIWAPTHMWLLHCIKVYILASAAATSKFLWWVAVSFVLERSRRVWGTISHVTCMGLRVLFATRSLQVHFTCIFQVTSTMGVCYDTLRVTVQVALA